MIYSLIKALHLLALTVWIGTMLLSPWLIKWADHIPVTSRPQMLPGLRYQFQRLSIPAMLGTLTMGVALASLGGWFSSPWMEIKLLLVVCLTALHGFFSGQIRRLCTDSTYRPPPWITRLFWVELIVVLGIIALVVFKPA